MKPDESGVFKALRLISKTDWRSLLLLVTALTGALGFAWNKVELYIQQGVTAENTLEAKSTKEAAGGAYEVMATRLDELFFKVEALEQRLNMRVDYVPVAPDLPEPGVVTTTTTESPPPKPEPATVATAVADEPEAAGGGAETTAEVVGSIMGGKKPAPVSKKFSRARLPEFDVIQQQAQGADLEDFISEVKGK